MFCEMLATARAAFCIRTVVRFTLPLNARATMIAGLPRPQEPQTWLRPASRRRIVYRTSLNCRRIE